MDTEKKKTGRLAEVIIVTKENIVIKEKLSASASAALDLYYVPHFKKNYLSSLSVKWT